MCLPAVAHVCHFHGMADMGYSRQTRPWCPCNSRMHDAAAGTSFVLARGRGELGRVGCNREGRGQQHSTNSDGALQQQQPTPKCLRCTALGVVRSVLGGPGPVFYGCCPASCWHFDLLWLLGWPSSTERLGWTCSRGWILLGGTASTNDGSSQHACPVVLGLQ
jgi:hypothetical protein